MEVLVLHEAEDIQQAVSWSPVQQGRKLVNDDTEQAGILNKFFSSVFTEKDITNVPKSKQLYGGNDPFDGMYFQRREGENIKGLKARSAPGPDL